SKTFWLAAVPAFLLLAQTIGAPFGYKWDFVVLNQQLAAIINAAFGLLAIIGVVVDPTTVGIKDSQRVMEKMKDNK
ncbi:phage holin, partial [Lactococcus petauri]|uniref:phage holin n=1 Tax=Lactococcus petauri TaxID=1940789 RepID=UPI001BCDA7B5